MNEVLEHAHSLADVRWLRPPLISAVSSHAPIQILTHDLSGLNV